MSRSNLPLYVCPGLNCPLAFAFTRGALVIGLTDGAAFYNPSTRGFEALDVEQWRDRFHESMPTLGLEQWAIIPQLTYRKGGAALRSNWTSARCQRALDRAKISLFAHLPITQEVVTAMDMRNPGRRPRKINPAHIVAEGAD